MLRMLLRFPKGIFDGAHHLFSYFIAQDLAPSACPAGHALKRRGFLLPYTCPKDDSNACASLLLQNKARWGGGSLRGNPSRASSDRMAARRAVPVATQEATGIDSRDEGVPPQQ